MDGISAQLLKEIRPVLLSCGPFTNDRQLGAVFVDSRIALWKSHIVETDNLEERLDMLLDVLASRTNINGENALVLFLQVLLDRTHEMDSCHSKLAKIIGRLETVDKSPSSSSQSDTTSASPKLSVPKLNRFQLYNILIGKFDLRELDNLAFFLEISLEDIPGGTRDGKIRELIQYAERHSRFEELIQKMGEIHPEAFDKYR